jgi:hypothetical protein
VFSTSIIIVSNGGISEHSNEPSGSIKCWEILEKLQIWLLLKKGSAP